MLSVSVVWRFSVRTVKVCNVFCPAHPLSQVIKLLHLVNNFTKTINPDVWHKTLGITCNPTCPRPSRHTCVRPQQTPVLWGLTWDWQCHPAASVAAGLAAPERPPLGGTAPAPTTPGRQGASWQGPGWHAESLRTEQAPGQGDNKKQKSKAGYMRNVRRSTHTAPFVATPCGTNFRAVPKYTAKYRHTPLWVSPVSMFSEVLQVWSTNICCVIDKETLTGTG